MIAVIFEVTPKQGCRQTYLDMAAALKTELEKVDGLISIERFESIYAPGKLLSLQFWKDEASLTCWRNVQAHRAAQELGRSELFENYCLRVANVVRDYAHDAREQAPADSRAIHG